MTGCVRSTHALFTRPELISCGRLAVLGLTPEQEQIFMASYLKTFTGPAVTFVERARLLDIVSEQDLLRRRLNEKTRAKIKQILGVEALIMCQYYDGTIGVRRKKLRVRIVHSATAAVVGSVITRGRDDFERHADIAVKALKADVMGAGRYRRRGR